MVYVAYLDDDSKRDHKIIYILTSTILNMNINEWYF